MTRAAPDLRLQLLLPAPWCSVLFPAILRGEGLYQHLERCLVLAPGLLCELRSLLLGPPVEATEQAFPGLESWCRVSQCSRCIVSRLLGKALRWLQAAPDCAVRPQYNACLCPDTLLHCSRTPC